MLISNHLFLCIYIGSIRLDGGPAESWPSWEYIQSSKFWNFCPVSSVRAQMFPDLTWNYRSHPSSLIEHRWKYKNERTRVSYSLREHGAMAKCMIFTIDSGCHGYLDSGQIYLLIMQVFIETPWFTCRNERTWFLCTCISFLNLRRQLLYKC